MGGPSSEYEVSLDSGRNVVKNLDRSRFEVFPVVINRDGEFPIQMNKLADFDLAFLALHGPFGEDGTIQEIMEQIGLPYTGSRVAASRLGMNKIASKKLFQTKGIMTPEFLVIGGIGELEEAARSFGYPLVVKPSNQGSSVGVSIVRDRSALELAFDQAAA